MPPRNHWEGEFTACPPWLPVMMFIRSLELTTLLSSPGWLEVRERGRERLMLCCIFLVDRSLCCRQDHKIYHQHWDCFYFKENHYVGNEGTQRKAASWALAANVWTLTEHIKATRRAQLGTGSKVCWGRLLSFSVVGEKMHSSSLEEKIISLGRIWPFWRGQISGRSMGRKDCVCFCLCIKNSQDGSLSTESVYIVLIAVLCFQHCLLCLVINWPVLLDLSCLFSVLWNIVIPAGLASSLSVFLRIPPSKFLKLASGCPTCFDTAKSCLFHIVLELFL